MEQSFIVVPIILTSACASLVARRGFGLSWSRLRVAAGKMLACIGVTVIFLVANLAAAMLMILADRVLTGGYVSLYLANDVVLLVLSLLQALTFQWWRESSKP